MRDPISALPRRQLLLTAFFMMAGGVSQAHDPLSNSSGDKVEARSATAARDPLANRFGGPFSLLDHTGRRVSDANFRGRFMLVYFGFSRCTDTCPADLLTIATALNSLGAEAEPIVPILITVDPANDTPAVLAPYVDAFHARLLGLTGTEAEIAAVAKAYRVHRRKVARSAVDYSVDHGSLTYLMGTDGQFLTLLPHKTAPEALASILRKDLAGTSVGN
jgi:protein SCO1/2